MIAVLSNMFNKEFEECTKIPSLSLNAFDKLPLPTSSHADMLLFLIDKTVFCYNDYYMINEDVFREVEKLGYEVIKIKKECKGTYPEDIALNVLLIGKRIFCNTKHTAKEILDYASSHNYQIVDVKQGYASCSTLVINESLAITADAGMRKALERKNIKVLQISDKGINLNGYNCGLIGGSAVTINKTVYFFGSIQKHSSCEKIKEFLYENNYSYFEIGSKEVYDYGGVKIFLKRDDI